MRELLRAMTPLKRRIRRIRLHRGLAIGACVGAALCLAAMAVSFFVPLRGLPVLCAALLTGSILAAALIFLMMPVRPLKAARAGDERGLQERLQTALTLTGNTPMEQLQLQDTLAALKGFSVRSLPLPRMYPLWLVTAALVLVWGALYLVPNPQTQVLAQAAAFETAMEEAAATAEQMNLDTLSESDRQEARKLVDDLARQLRQAREPVDALLAVSQAEERLEKLQQRMAGDAQAAMENALQAQGLDALAQALGSHDEQQMAQALENANVQAMEDAAQQLSGDMQQQLMQAIQALQAEDISAALSQLMSSGQSSAAAQLSSLSQGLSGLRKQSLAGSSQQKGQGSGAGQGTTNEDHTEQAEDSPGGSGNATPRRREGEYERIYDPTHLEAEQTDLTAQSPTGSGESIQAELGPGAGSLDGTVPYNQVALEYAQTASQAADSQNLTTQERQWVTDYFSALTE